MPSPLQYQVTQSHRDSIKRIGEDIFVRRYVGTGTARTRGPDVKTQAVVNGYQPIELVGSIVQGDVKVIALVDTLEALLPLTTNDILVIRGKEFAIKSVDDNTRRVGGVLVALVIHAAG
nr:MAG TPA: hypothetical protein [Caudoviricetes sp.]